MPKNKRKPIFSKSIRRLSAAIANDIFTAGPLNQKASHLILIGPAGHDLGGWGEIALARRIEKWLNGELREATCKQAGAAAD